MTDLVAALHAALAVRTDGYTVTELVALAKLPDTHVSKIKIRSFLKQEIAAGRIRPAMGRRQAIDGAARSAPIYLPVNPKSKK